MELAATLESPLVADSLTLGDTIEKLGAEFSNMRSSLRQARGEIARLRGELARLRPSCRAMPRLDVAALRRRVAYHCHPDRGGDPELMSTLNTLFDFLECLESSREENAR